jgi:peptide/nickel transport system substrate-binding protein
MRSSFDRVAKVEKVDDYTVKVTWKEPYAPGLSAWNFHIMPKHVYAYPKGKGSAFNKHPRNAEPVGTGPFVFSEWKRGDRIVLKANPSYFMGRPHLDQITFKIIPQSQTLMAAYNTGQLDLTSISAEQWRQLRNDQAFLKGASVFEFSARQFHYIAWNMDGSNPFFSDKRVRQAMTYATNRQGIVDKVLDGHGVVASGPFSLKGWEANPKVAPYPYDPAKAGALLDGAGWKDTNGDGIREKDGKPFSFECLVPSEAEMYARWLEIFQQDLKRVGVDLKIRKVEYSVFLDRTHRHQFQAFLVGFGMGDDPDPFGLLHSSQARLLPSGMGEGQNDVSYKNPEVDRLIEAEERTFDFKKRQLIFWRIHEIVAEDQPCTYLLVDTQMAAVKNRFQNVRVSRSGYGLFTWYPSLIQWWVPKEMQK